MITPYPLTGELQQAKETKELRQDVGWVHSDYINNEITTHNLNVRDHNRDVLTTIPQNTIIVKTGEVDGDWVQIEKPFIRELKPNYLTRQEVRELVAKHWPESEVETMVDIIHCESGFDTNAHNLNHQTGDNSWGLAQVNIYGGLKYTRPSPSELVKPEKNIEYAYKTYQKQGYSAWTRCYERSAH